MHGGSLEQHAGSISCQSCAARDSGGCMHMRSIKQLSSPKQLYLNGTFHAENCSAKLGQSRDFSFNPNNILRHAWALVQMLHSVWQTQAARSL